MPHDFYLPLVEGDWWVYSPSIRKKNYLEQVLGRTPNWQDREIWFSISNNKWELLTLKYKAQPQEVLVFPFLSLVLGF